MVRADAAVFRGGIQRGQLQGHDVHEDEVARAGVVEAVEHGVDARDVVDDSSAALLRVGQQRVVAEVVRPNPHRVDCLAGRDIEERLVGSWDAVCSVGEEGRQLVAGDVWEWR